MTIYNSQSHAFLTIFNNLLLSQGFQQADIERSATRCKGLILDLIGDTHTQGNNLSRDTLASYTNALVEAASGPTERKILVPQCVQGEPRILFERLTLDMSILLPQGPTIAPSLVDAFVNLVFANAH